MNKVIQIITNNHCNLHCEHCSLLCHIPFNVTPFRKKWTMPVSDAELFCERLEGHFTDFTHKLLGGETTAIPLETLYGIIDVFHTYGRKLKLLTNGYNLLGLDKKHLNKIAEIELNDHGINQFHILTCHKYLKSNFNGNVVLRTQKRHYNLGEARKHCVPGFPCKSIMSPPILYRKVFYPCCIHPAMELWNSNDHMREVLIGAGWSLNNPDVSEVLLNWRRLLPEYVIDQCSYHCWIPRRLDKKIESVPITLKPNDVIKR